VRHRLSVDEIRRIITNAGYEARQRNTFYELVEKGKNNHEGHKEHKDNLRYQISDPNYSPL
jgi:hypothetical protein